MRKFSPNIACIRILFLVTVILLTQFAKAQVTQNWTSNGSWTCPNGVFTVTVETWGGGGAGGGVTTASRNGGGGGGGAYNTAVLAVTPGMTYNYVVGQGGVGGSGNGISGTASSFNGGTVANGGGGGTGNLTAGAGGAGGTGGTRSGGNGSAGVSGTRSGSGGGGAGSTANGQNGGVAVGGAPGAGNAGGTGGAGKLVATPGTGSAGGNYGGGGGGAINNATTATRNGGDGGDGLVRIQYTCGAPSSLASALSLIAYSQIIDGSFTATAADGYLVIRTTTSTAPTTPVNGTSYTVGASALGGIVDDFGSTVTFQSTGLSASTTYWYWVYSYNSVCAGSPNYNTAPLTGNITTLACGAQTNTVTMPQTGTVNWSAASWSLGHLPTSCENVQVTFAGVGSTASDQTVKLDIDVDADARNVSFINTSTGTSYRKVFKTVLAQGKTFDITGNFLLTSPSVGGLAGDSCTYSSIGTTTIMGNATVGASGDVGYCVIGSSGSTANQTFIFKGDLTFNAKSYTLEEHSVFIFDGTGTQTVTNNTNNIPYADALLFDIFKIGNGVNTPTLVFAGSNPNAYMNDKGGYLMISPNCSLVLPANFTFNAEDIVTTGTFNTAFTLSAGATLKLGGNSGGQTGSNFPKNFPSLTLAATSTVDYNGNSGITQTVYGGVNYSKLIISNGAGTGRAAKITTAAVTVNSTTTIKALADLTLGSTLSSAGNLDVISTGGLYCNANVVSGTGAFTLNSGAYLGMGHAQGISVSGSATGNIQMTGGRSYNTAANYIYNGAVNQITGNGLPVTCNDLTIANTAGSGTVTISNGQNINGTYLLQSGTFVADNQKIRVTGPNALMNSTGGFMKANKAVLEINNTASATAQSLSGNWFTSGVISTLINSHLTGISIAASPADTLLIASALLYGTTGSTITTNDNLTLLSRDTATARFGDMTGNSITGKVTVERYLPTLRKWRHLAVNTSTTQTIKQAWMENNPANGNTAPGYGTIVTDDQSTWSANGFDSKSISGPSLKYFNPVTNAYTGVSATSNLLNAQSSYYNFVRGDRSCTPANSTVAATILRSQGSLKTGTQTFNVSAGKFASIGNPYASAVDLRLISRSNVGSFIYVWDPKLTGTYGLGAYQTLSFNGTDWVVTPGGGNYGIVGSKVDTLESGQAFFVKSPSTAGTVIFNETNKTGGARTMARGGSTEGRFTADSVETVYALLSLTDPGVSTLVDGVMANYSRDFSNAVDSNDAEKMVNTSENISFKRNNALMSVERRHEITLNDTLYINMTGLKAHAYKWDILFNNMDKQGRKAFLLDSYLESSTPLNLDSSNSIQFNVVSIPGAYAPGRFKIVFSQPAVPKQPIRFTGITAERNNDLTVNVLWYTQYEDSVSDFKIEHSDDGAHFNPISSETAINNIGGSATYLYTDKEATKDDNFYRVRANMINGTQKLSAVVKVGRVAQKSSMSIFPNPISGKKINLNLTQISGLYQYRVVNSVGQIILNNTIKIEDSDIIRNINLPENTATGSYILQLTDATGIKTSLKFMVR